VFKLKGIRKMIDDRRKASAERKKKKEGDDTTAGGAAGASDDVPSMPPPAKYTGPVPNGMGQEPELSEWVSMRLYHENAQYVRCTNGFDACKRSTMSTFLTQFVILV
jgi:hypothetical protein